MFAHDSPEMARAMLPAGAPDTALDLPARQFLYQQGLDYRPVESSLWQCDVRVQARDWTRYRGLS